MDQDELAEAEAELKKKEEEQKAFLGPFPDHYNPHADLGFLNRLVNEVINVSPEPLLVPAQAREMSQMMKVLDTAVLRREQAKPGLLLECIKSPSGYVFHPSQFSYQTFMESGSSRILLGMDDGKAYRSNGKVWAIPRLYKLVFETTSQGDEIDQIVSIDPVMPNDETITILLQYIFRLPQERVEEIMRLGRYDVFPPEKNRQFFATTDFYRIPNVELPPHWTVGCTNPVYPYVKSFNDRPLDMSGSVYNTAMQKYLTVVWMLREFEQRVDLVLEWRQWLERLEVKPSLAFRHHPETIRFFGGERFKKLALFWPVDYLYGLSVEDVYGIYDAISCRTQTTDLTRCQLAALFFPTLNQDKVLDRVREKHHFSDLRVVSATHNYTRRKESRLLPRPNLIHLIYWALMMPETTGKQVSPMLLTMVTVLHVMYETYVLDKNNCMGMKNLITLMACYLGNDFFDNGLVRKFRQRQTIDHPETKTYLDTLKSRIKALLVARGFPKGTMPLLTMKKYCLVALHWLVSMGYLFVVDIRTRQAVDPATLPPLPPSDQDPTELPGSYWSVFMDQWWLHNFHVYVPESYHIHNCIKDNLREMARRFYQEKLDGSDPEEILEFYRMAERQGWTDDECRYVIAKLQRREENETPLGPLECRSLDLACKTMMRKMTPPEIHSLVVPPKLCTEQKLANIAISRSPGEIIKGMAGSGKTTTIADLMRRKKGNHIMALAFMKNHIEALRKAVQGNQSSQTVRSFTGTIHQLLEMHEKTCYNIQSTEKQLEIAMRERERYRTIPMFREAFLDKTMRCPLNFIDTLVLEELSVLETMLLAALLHRAVGHPCCAKRLRRLIAMGDGRQLPPIGPGNMIIDLSRAYGLVPYEHMHRQKSVYLSCFVLNLLRRDFEEMLKYVDHDTVRYLECMTGKTSALRENLLSPQHPAQIIEQLLEQLGVETVYNSLIMASTNEICNQISEVLNRWLIRKLWDSRGRPLQEYDQLFQGGGFNLIPGAWYPGQIVSFGENDQSLGLVSNQRLVIDEVLEVEMVHIPVFELTRMAYKLYHGFSQKILEAAETFGLNKPVDAPERGANPSVKYKINEVFYQLVRAFVQVRYRFLSDQQKAHTEEELKSFRLMISLQQKVRQLMPAFIEKSAIQQHMEFRDYKTIMSQRMTQREVHYRVFRSALMTSSIKAPSPLLVHPFFVRQRLDGGWFELEASPSTSLSQSIVGPSLGEGVC